MEPVQQKHQKQSLSKEMQCTVPKDLSNLHLILASFYNKTKTTTNKRASSINMNLVPADPNITADYTYVLWLQPDKGNESPDSRKYWMKSLGRGRCQVLK